MAKTAIAALLLAFASTGICQPPPMATNAYPLPTGLSSGPDSPRELLEKSGITFPEGSEAFFDKKASVFYLRNTIENLDLADFLFLGFECGSASQLAISIQTFECTLPERPSSPAPFPLEISDLRRLPQADIKLLDQVDVVTRSGMKTPFCHTFFTPTEVPANSERPQASGNSGIGTSLAANEYGTRVAIEPILGPDGLTIDASIEYQFRVATGQNETGDFSFVGASIQLNNCPEVVFSAPYGGQKGRHLVVVANIRLITKEGFDILSPVFSAGQAGQTP